MKNSSKTKRRQLLLFPILGSFILAFSLNASAQWKWIDANGVTQYSDAPPPSSVPQDKILKRPANSEPSGGNMKDGGVSAPTANPEVDEQKLKEQKEKDELDKRVKEQEKQKKEEEEKQKKEQEKKRKADCNNAKKALANFKAGERIRQVNSKGEYEYLDDKAIEANRKQILDYINKNCR